MLVQFKLIPDGVGDEPGVKFDITRQKNRSQYFQIGSEVFGPSDVAFPIKKDLANDDGIQNDEDNKPKNNHVFSVDSPSASLIQSSNQVAPPDGTKLVYSGNFYEFVRVRFDGERPTGNNLEGSRCSEKLKWKTQQIGVKKDGVIVRIGPKNWIKEGHENIIKKP